MIPAPTVATRKPSLSRGSALALIIRVCGAGGLMLSHIVLARSLGVAGFGEYAQAIAWAQVLCVFGKSGFDQASLRYVSEYVAKNETSSLYGFLRDSTTVSIFCSITVMLSVILVVFFRWNAIGAGLASCTIISSIMIPLVSLRQVQEAGLRGIGQIFESQICTSIWPLTLFVLAGIVWLVSPSTMSPPTATLLHLISLSVTSIIVYRFVTRANLLIFTEIVDVSGRRQWFTSAAAFLFAELLIVLKSRIGVAMAGAILGEDSAGLYAAMERFADVSLLGLQSLGMVIAPQFAALYAAGKYPEMRRLMWQGQLLGLAYALPVAVAVACLSDFLFILLGEGYRQGWVVLMALLASTCITALSGPGALVLQMTGHERTMLLIIAACAFTNIGFSLLLIGPLGILGLGYAQIATSLVWTISIHFCLKQHVSWQHRQG